MSSSKELPISNHTFLYPFFYKDSCSLIKRIINNTKHGNEDNNCPWVMDRSFREDDGPIGKKTTLSELEEEDILRYAEFHYFVPAAQELLFNIEKSTPSDYYQLERNDIDKNSNYCLTIGYERDGKFIGDGVYTLTINQIRLSVYDSLNIGILAIELEYFGEYEYKGREKIEKTIVDQVTEINEFGRRVFPPALSYEIESGTEKIESIHSIMGMNAKTIEIFIGDRTIKQDFYNIDINKLRNTQSIIERILCYKHEDNRYKEKQIYPALDDRMFSVCVVRKNDYYPVKKIPTNNYYNYLEPGSNASKELYRFVFLEAIADSCQSDIMRQQKLKEHIYDRWIEYGTVYGITEYSMICLTGEAEFLIKSVINPFLTEYIDMVKLALIQRAVIIHLEDEASDISKKIKIDNEYNENEELNSRVKDSQKLWKKYIKFQNEFYIPEVTFQEQGSEIYAMLKKSLKIEELNQYLEDELNDFHALSEMEEDNHKKRAEEQRENMNTTINLMAVVGIILAIVSMAQDYLTDIINFEERKYIVSGGIIFLIGYTLLLIINIWALRLFGNNNDKKTEKKLSTIWIIVLLLVFVMMIWPGILSNIIAILFGR